MTTPRNLTVEQRAAHVVLPWLAQFAAAMGAEVTARKIEAKAGRKDFDTKMDWAEVIARAQGRKEAADEMVAYFRKVARGE